MSQLKGEVLTYRKIINNLKFNKLTNQQKLEHFINYANLCYGYREFDECWKYYKFHLLKSKKLSKYPKSLKDKNKKIKFLENINDLYADDKLLIWDDGGFGDLILHFRLLKLFPKKNIMIINKKSLNPS